jgi:hypothetical protein
MALERVRMKLETSKRVLCGVLEKGPTRCTIMVSHLILEGL